MVKPGGCAPGFEIKVINGIPRCVPVKGLPISQATEKCKDGWRFSTEKNACVRKDEEPCKPGWIFDPEKDRCVLADKQTIEKKKEIKNSCKDGWGYDAVTDSCVKEQECSEGHVFNPTLNACVTKTPECKTGWAFDEQQNSCVLIDKIEGQSCPVDSDFDPDTGACMPHGRRRPLSVIDKVPRPRKIAYAWRYDPVEPVLVSPDSKVIKTTYGDLIRSSYSDLLHKCTNAGPTWFIVSDGIDNIYVGPSKYRASNLYAIAEEIYGKPIINPRTRRPLPEAIGRELMLFVRYSYGFGEQGPLIVEGRNRVFYVVEPQYSTKKW